MKKTTKLKILVDVDGVACDIVGEVIYRLNERLGPNYINEDITVWDFLHPQCDILTQNEKLNVLDIFREEFLCQVVNVIPGIKEKLKELKDDGHEIVWLTAPWKQSKTWCYDRTIWIERHFGDISKNVIFASHKEDVPGDILIDDNPENLRKWKAVYPDGEAILFS